MQHSHPYQVPPDVLKKYSTTAPRYTSYPTAPVWKDSVTDAEVAGLLQGARAQQRALSLYVHIPFCHKLCWYCGCNMMVTRNAALVERYLSALTQEIRRVGAAVGRHRSVVQVHWGGGTPTFLSSAQIARVQDTLAEVFVIRPDAEMSMEVHPPVTTPDQVETLARLGFNRVSMGVQDFDPKVQEAVHRIQPFAQTRDLIQHCRQKGFVSVNVDLMYGLPHQDVDSFRRTLDRMEELRVDRIALFGFAHMPNILKHQRLLQVDALPSPAQRLAIFESALERLLGLGYRYIGLDHFALPDNELAVALDKRSLRRNFMGYTTCAESDVLAFGSSSITDLDVAYLQNARTVEPYLQRMEQGGLAVTRGLMLNADDQLRREVISQLFCHLQVNKPELEQRFAIRFDDYFAPELAQLVPMQQDGLLELSGTHITLTPRGQVLLRNIAALFDVYLRRPAHKPMQFSQTV